MTQTNPFAEPRFPNIPPFSLTPEPPEELETEREDSTPFPDPPIDDDTKEKPGGGQ